MMAEKEYAGVWSATPTPFTEEREIDGESVERMIEHHISLGVDGLLVGGTCGEGPFMRRSQLTELTTAAAGAARGRLHIAVQVTDNSPERVLDNASEAKRHGADVAVVAEPWFPHLRAGEKEFLNHYHRIAEDLPLPMGLYVREVCLSRDGYRRILMHPNVRLVKDSTMDIRLLQAALSAGEEKEDLVTMTGYEFGMAPYLKAGYDGVVAGGGIIIGAFARRIREAVRNGNLEEARRLEEETSRILHICYGGDDNASWLTGLKYTLVQMGIFNSGEGYMSFPFPDDAREEIDRFLEEEGDVLFEK